MNINMLDVLVFDFLLEGGTDAFITFCTYILGTLLGLVVGSFLNVVIYRLPNNMSLSKPRSHCTKCNYQLRWYDNIPVISYLILGGKCRKCGEHISFRYTVVELLNMLLWALCAFCLVDKAHIFVGKDLAASQTIIYGVLCMIACSVFVCIAFIDLDHMYIPDRFHIILAALGIIAIVTNLVGWGNDGILWYERLIGAAGSGVLFLIIYFAGMLIYKREAMGLGDVKLVAAAGLLLGWKNMALGLLFGAVIGAITLTIIKRTTDAEKYKEYPFGPFLVIGMMIAMFFGTPLINWYIGLIG